MNTDFFEENPKSKIVIHITIVFLFLLASVFAYLVLVLFGSHVKNFIVGMTSYERLGQYSEQNKIDIKLRYKTQPRKKGMHQPLIEMKHLYREYIDEAIETDNWTSQGIDLLITDQNFSTMRNCQVMCCKESQIPQDELRV